MTLVKISRIFHLSISPLILTQCHNHRSKDMYLITFSCVNTVFTFTLYAIVWRKNAPTSSKFTPLLKVNSVASNNHILLSPKKVAIMKRKSDCFYIKHLQVVSSPTTKHIKNFLKKCPSYYEIKYGRKTMGMLSTSIIFLNTFNHCSLIEVKFFHI